MDEDILIGRATVAHGFASARDVLDCVRLQARVERKTGERMTLAAILVRQGLVDAAGLDVIKASIREGAPPPPASLRETADDLPWGDVAIARSLGAQGEVRVGHGDTTRDDLGSTQKLVFRLAQAPAKEKPEDTLRMRL